MIVKCHFAFKITHAKTTLSAITVKIQQTTETPVHRLKGKYINQFEAS